MRAICDRQGRKVRGIYPAPLKGDASSKPRLIVIVTRGTEPHYCYTDENGRPIYDITTAKRVRDALKVELAQRGRGIIPDAAKRMKFRDAVDSLTKGVDAPLAREKDSGRGERVYRSVNPGIESIPIRILLRHLGDMPLEEFNDPELLVRYLATRKQRQQAGVKRDGTTPYFRDGAGDNTLRKDLMTLGVLFDFFVRRKLCANNHARETIKKHDLMPKKRNPGRNAARTVLSNEQLAAYRLAAWEVLQTDPRAMQMLIGAYTGQRMSEIQRVRRDWVKLDKKQKCIVIPPNTESRRTQKSDAFDYNRQVWIDDELAAHIGRFIEEVVSEDGMLMPNKMKLIDEIPGKIDEDRLKKMHGRVFKRAGKIVPMEWFSIYSLRHTVGTNFFRQDLPTGVSMGNWLKAVADHMGHSPEMLVKKYVHISKPIDLYGRGAEVDENDQVGRCKNPSELLAKLSDFERRGAPPKVIATLRCWAERSAKASDKASERRRADSNNGRAEDAA